MNVGFPPNQLKRVAGCTLANLPVNRTPIRRQRADINNANAPEKQPGITYVSILPCNK